MLSQDGKYVEENFAWGFNIELWSFQVFPWILETNISWSSAFLIMLKNLNLEEFKVDNTLLKT